VRGSGVGGGWIGPGVGAPSTLAVPTRALSCSFARAGLLPAIEARIAQLLAGGTSAAALTAAVAAQTSHNNSVLANTLAMCVAVAARRTDEMAGEAINCKVWPLEM